MDCLLFIFHHNFIYVLEHWTAIGTTMELQCCHRSTREPYPIPATIDKSTNTRQNTEHILFLYSRSDTMSINWCWSIQANRNCWYVKQIKQNRNKRIEKTEKNMHMIVFFSLVLSVFFIRYFSMSHCLNYNGSVILHCRNVSGWLYHFANPMSIWWRHTNVTKSQIPDKSIVLTACSGWFRKTLQVHITRPLWPVG